jgi:DNA-binding GntR family transcriptional regulator
MVPAGTPGIKHVPDVTYSNHVGIDHDSPTPLYVQLAALLRGQIEDGTLTGRVPSVKSLSQEHGVSHITAEKALAVLKDAGIVLSVIGKGTFVAGRQ